MHAEVIAIGDELTSGQRLDTNSQWISQRLGELGIRTLYHTTVGDQLEANVNVFRTAASRAELIFCTGGLGPTADDLTRQALAAAAGVPLVKDQGALRHIQQMFASRHREMPVRNEIQAMFPAGARIVPNPHGTAPGIDFDWPHREGVRVIALPGVPAEMREMWEITVAPAVGGLYGGGRVIRHEVIKCFGIGESDMEERLPDLIRRGREPAVGITVHKATITLRITAQGDSEALCRQLMQPTRETIYTCLGDLVFGHESDELQDAVVRLLQRQQATLWVVESGTGGLLCDWLTLADPSGEVFVGGEVDRRLQPNPDALASRAMAAQSQASLVLAVGPFPVAPGRFHVATCDRSNVELHDCPYSGHPDILRERSAKLALDRLRLELLAREMS